MNIFWGIVNVLIAMGIVNFFGLYGLAMYAMAHDNPNKQPDASFKRFMRTILAIFALLGIVGAMYFLKNAWYYFTL